MQFKSLFIGFSILLVAIILIVIFVEIKNQKMGIRKFIYTSVVLLGLLYSCQSSKNVVYVQNAGSPIELGQSTLPTLPDMIVKNGDLLMITVSTITPEACAPFNPPMIADPTRTTGVFSSMTSSPVPLSYIVDNLGNITFPVLGKLSVVGQTKSQIEEMIRTLIYPRYLNENPIVTMREVNYKVSIMGEVTRPGVVMVSNERISIFEALAQAGDLTIYGCRDNVLLIREDLRGKRESFRIDLRDKKLIDSPYFYLQQNDVIYVTPNKSKTNSSAIGAGEYMIFTILGSLLSVTSLIFALIK
jgi:polysaccharide export outer membrane protein